ncbi:MULTISPECIES: cytochrome C [unclassified Kaistella]|uniref:cytochrome C n=1 Tax=unclassified Kaistella TaxID=2762626 RepID=UPI0027369AF0|nr:MULTISPECIES: cytochrome C [unclassified Kaistella]MDP2453675.1 cytochrome C [Kaistella sp. SH11-4b]MDP2456732.1 cytochrome C [Kaistella sp. SH40-3]MDP2459488.1 cytochrome C [Kaistella sp. SH19-2b]
MTKDSSSVYLFIDDEIKPLAELHTPIVFDFDTSKLSDGEHVLKIVSKSPAGREGIRKINFIVKNGPSISVEGLKDDDIVDGILPLMINAYDKGNQKSFVIEGSETPQTVPVWMWVIIILIAGWGAYYGITYFSGFPY